ncbi:hypothetical protein AVEN_63250-1 [Araneus ventricosus]|uniref:Transposase Tc1-like domain-containing protein n=1 Tax=Araneus ventricosus TaxID=182803 RepID=A0A4Y2B3R8_ARAVE|nr:hypothetical protein AVEN_63250-1 [Araneus ventricosus]
MDNNPGRECEEILRASTKRKMIGSEKKSPVLSAPKLASSISSEAGKSFSAETVRHALHYAGLHGRTSILNLFVSYVDINIKTTVFPRALNPKGSLSVGWVCVKGSAYRAPTSVLASVKLS